MKKTISLALIAGAFLFALAVTHSRAQDVAPDVLVKTVTADVLAIIKQNKNTQAGNAKRIAELVETRVFSHFDFTRMTRLAMGRNWRLASPEQQKALTAEFKTLLVHTYSASITNYRDQTIAYRPLRMASGDTEVTVRSEVKDSGPNPITIDYDLASERPGRRPDAAPAQFDVERAFEHD